jgi:hypothetical protein
MKIIYASDLEKSKVYELEKKNIEMKISDFELDFTKAFFLNKIKFNKQSQSKFYIYTTTDYSCFDSEMQLRLNTIFRNFYKNKRHLIRKELKDIFDLKKVAKKIKIRIDTNKSTAIDTIRIKVFTDGIEKHLRAFIFAQIQSKKSKKQENYDDYNLFRKCDFSQNLQHANIDDSVDLLKRYNNQKLFNLEKLAQQITSVASTSINVYEENLQHNFTKLELIANTNSSLIKTITHCNIDALYQMCKKEKYDLQSKKK